MAIVFDAASDDGGANSWLHTCTGNDRLLVVGVCVVDSVGVSGVTYNGVALTQVAEVNSPDSGDDPFVSLWYLVNPAAGEHTVAVSYGATPGARAAGAISFTGVHQTDPLDLFDTDVSDTDTVSVTLVGVAEGSMGVDVAGTKANETHTVPGDQAARWSQDATKGSGSTKPQAAANLTMSRSGTTGIWAYVAATFNPAISVEVSPVVITITEPGVTATSQEVRTASVSPVTLTLTPAAVTATYVQVETASVDPVVLTLSAPEIHFGEYSREATSTFALPATDADLSTIYSEAERDDVAADDDVRVGVTGTRYVLHQFEETNENNTDRIVGRWVGQSNVAPSAVPVVMQIYNFDTDLWETVDSDSATAADTDFELTATINANVEDYYGVNNVVAFRIYQG